VHREATNTKEIEVILFVKLLHLFKKTGFNFVLEQLHIQSCIAVCVGVN
jgi:hypothetical protein